MASSFEIPVSKNSRLSRRFNSKEEALALADVPFWTRRPAEFNVNPAVWRSYCVGCNDHNSHYGTASSPPKPWICRSCTDRTIEWLTSQMSPFPPGHNEFGEVAP